MVVDVPTPRVVRPWQWQTYEMAEIETLFDDYSNQFITNGAKEDIFIPFTTVNRCSKLTHTGVEIDTCAFQTGYQLSTAALDMSLELFFFHNFSGVKRSCWTTGSWRSCLSLEVVSSIPAGSTIIYRFLWGFICVSLYQSIKIKPTNIYIFDICERQLNLITHSQETYVVIGGNHWISETYHLRRYGCIYDIC